MRHFFGLVVVMFTLAGTACKEKRYADPLSPEKALSSFHLREGFKIELFASEPDVLDPVEMTFDEEGRAYVVEMPDYPFKPEAGKEAGKIKILTDTDRDGRVDQSTIFADSLSEATSILPWKDGLLVTSAPYILFLKDTNGDNRADIKEVLFSGFFASNSEAQITSLRFGVDNWIYAANNGQPGKVTFAKKPDVPELTMGGSDFRFRLDRGQFELETGQAQFGLTMDDWGHRFITQNTLHIRQVVIPWRYLNRNPHLPSTSPMQNISDHDLAMYQETPPPYWRAERTKRRQKQYKEENLGREEYAEDHFTGCSGGTVYAGDAFPKEYYGNVFTGDVAGNLVHRDILIPGDDTPVLIARRDEGEQDREFLSSTDPWFRPAGFAVGPDGFLYVIDIYRQHIETPISIPEDLKEDMDFLNGSQYGRIYRIAPESMNPTLQGKSGSEKRSTGDYVALLSHPNRWWRLQAQRVLLERQDVSAVPAVTVVFRTHIDARARLHALYVLEGLNALSAEVVGAALKDKHPGVREHGLILAERYPTLLPQIISGTQDSIPQVAFQAALSLGQFSGKAVESALANVIITHGEDPWFRTAVLSADSGSHIPLLELLKKQRGFFSGTESWKKSFIGDFSTVIGSRNNPLEVASLLGFLSEQSGASQNEWRVNGVRGLANGLKKSSDADSTFREKLEHISSDSTADVELSIQTLKALTSKPTKI